MAFMNVNFRKPGQYVMTSLYLDEADEFERTLNGQLMVATWTIRTKYKWFLEKLPIRSLVSQFGITKNDSSIYAVIE